VDVNFPRLFDPGVIGNIKVKNRVVKAPQHTGLCAPDGSVTERLLRYYKEVALGGAGLIIVEYSWIDYDASRASACQLGAANVDHISGLSLLAQTIQANGAKAALQIAHCGAHKWSGIPPIKAPSRVPWEFLRPIGAPAPAELNFEEIQGIVKAFGDAAKRTQTAGFDMVEIHATHGYLIEEFLSPRTNKRADCYGGPLENRRRFLLEVAAEVRSRVGPDYPVSVRMGGFDYDSNQMPYPNYDEVIEVAKSLEKTGIDVLNISAGGRYFENTNVDSEVFTPLATNAWAAEKIKKNVGLPVMVCGSITNPRLAEEILESGKADFIAMGRPLFADPFWPKKAKAGRVEDIRPCIRCSDGCTARSDWLAKAVLCSVNAALGREEDFKISPAKYPKKVAIVGGGAAGMEAARVCALCGHDVTLFEKRKLGGVLHEASIPGFKSDIRPLISYFVTQMEKLKIKVIQKEATLNLLREEGFEAVVVAAGASPLIPKVPGIDNPIVCGALEVLNGEKKPGKKVIVIGGGMVGTEVGLFLAEKGYNIVFVEMLDEFMNGILPMEKPEYQKRLDKHNVSIYTGRRLVSIQDKGVIVDDRYGRQEEISGDSVVIAAGFQPNRGLIEALQSQTNLEVYEAGDCVKPRRIFEAIHEGHIAARQLINN
jgi:2,4-dienoyl-CoA reductase-like NADH-dependent reductase (Old Yellow Enzyme family)/thioredoxin reductase